MITVGTDAPSSEACLEVASRHDRVWATAGVHPHDAVEGTGALRELLDRVAGSPDLVAIGECGLDHHYDQLVVVDDKGKLVDLLTDRDIVVAEAREDIDADGNGLTVGEIIGQRGYRAAGVLSRHSAASEAIDLLRDERIGAVVITENGKVGEAPLGIITRGDVLKTS